MFSHIRRRSDNATDDAIKRINDQLISIRRLSDKLKNVNRLSDQLSIVNNDNLSQVYRLSDQLLEEQRLVNRSVFELTLEYSNLF